MLVSKKMCSQQDVLQYITPLIHTCQLSSNFQLLFPNLLREWKWANGCCSSCCSHSHHTDPVGGYSKSALISKGNPGTLPCMCSTVRRSARSSYIQEINQPFFGVPAKILMWPDKNWGASKPHCFSLCVWGTLVLTCLFQHKHSSLCIL